VRNPHGRVGHVDMLAAGAGSAEGIDAQVFFLDMPTP